jgi:hypothetical protein
MFSSFHLKNRFGPGNLILRYSGSQGITLGLFSDFWAASGEGGKLPGVFFTLGFSGLPHRKSEFGLLRI